MKKYWTQFDGTYIAISKMENTHILNTIKMLKKNAKVGVERVISYGYDGDDNYMTGVVELVQGKEYLDNVQEYKWLVDEAKKRKII